MEVRNVEIRKDPKRTRRVEQSRIFDAAHHLRITIELHAKHEGGWKAGVGWSACNTFEKIVPETHGLFAKNLTFLFLKHVDFFQMIPDET